METWEEAVIWLRNQPDQSELVHAAFFDDPVSTAAMRYRSSIEWKSLRALLPKNPGRALEIGAGRGVASYALAMDGWDTTALEPDPSQVVGVGAIQRLIEETGLTIHLVADWGESLPFNGNTFDIVLCRQVLHHARDLKAFCTEVGRVLKPGGSLFAIREHIISSPSDLPVFLNSHPLHHRYGGEMAYLLNDYLDAIGSGGLTVTTVLNPYQSEINTYPESLEVVRRKIARRLHLPPGALPFSVLAWLGARSKAPGRLYSFIARKPLYA
jgi:ubiquinone/menaquinone biosynthesis C-methylase UbiE